LLPARSLHSFPTRRSSDLLNLERFRLKPRRRSRSNLLFYRIIQRETASHFCWKCSSEASSWVPVRDLGTEPAEAVRSPAKSEMEDRKSTRLNSSHVKISYA